MKSLFVFTISLMLFLSVIPPQEGMSQVSNSDTISNKSDSLLEEFHTVAKRVDIKSDTAVSKILRNQKQAEKIAKQKPKVIRKVVFVEKPVPVIINPTVAESEKPVVSRIYDSKDVIFVGCDTVYQVHFVEDKCGLSKTFKSLKTKSNGIIQQSKQFFLKVSKAIRSRSQGS